MKVEDLIDDYAPETIVEFRSVGVGDVFTVPCMGGDDYFLKVSDSIYFNLRTNEIEDSFNRCEPTNPNINSTILDVTLVVRNLSPEEYLRAVAY